jgi:hypothetical protein
VKQRFKIGEYIAYRMRDIHGTYTIVGTVTGYLRGKKADWVTLTTQDSGITEAIPQYIPVRVPTVWADSLKPAE